MKMVKLCLTNQQMTDSILTVEQGQALIDKYFLKYNEVGRQCANFYSQGKEPPESLDMEELTLAYMLRHIKELLEAEGFECEFDMEQVYVSTSGTVKQRKV